MNTKSILPLLCFFSPVLALAMGGAPVTSPQPPGAVKPRFSSIMANSFKPRCLECHSAQYELGGLNLTSWSETMKAVKPYDPEGSDLWRWLRSDKMPENRPPLTAPEKQAIYDWIKSGAKND